MASEVPAIPPPTIITSETGVSQCDVSDNRGKSEDHLFFNEKLTRASPSKYEAAVAATTRAGGADARKNNRRENIFAQKTDKKEDRCLGRGKSSEILKQNEGSYRCFNDDRG
jgi:hypothetical protein